MVSKMLGGVGIIDADESDTDNIMIKIVLILTDLKKHFVLPK